MILQEHTRVGYKNTPLTQVICQIRFPAILSISATEPTDFQEKIRDDFPEFKSEPEITMGVQFDLAKQQVLPIAPSSPPCKVYKFSSIDGKWVVGLTNSNIYLLTHDYKNWDEFKLKFTNIMKPLLSLYKPTLYTRIGLKYTNVITNTIEDSVFHGHNFSELIKPEFLGVLACPENYDKDKINVSFYKTVLPLSNREGCSVIIQSGLATSPDSPDKKFMFDCDYSCNSQVKTNEYLNTLDFLHNCSTGLFQMITTEKMRDIMEIDN